MQNCAQICQRYQHELIWCRNYDINTYYNVHMPSSKYTCKCQNLWITIKLWLELAITVRQDTILSFLAPSTNGGSMNTDKVTQNLWSMGVDVRCCGGVFLLKVLGHMASPRNSRKFYFKKLSSSVRRLRLCYAWTFQQ